MKPWSNGTPNSSQLEPNSQLLRIWVSFGHPLGSSWMGLAWIWSSSNLHPTPAKFSTVRLSQPTQPTLARLFYCYVTTRSYSDNWMVSCKLAWLGGIVWPPADASFDFVTWFGLAVLCVARAKTFAVDQGSWGVGCSITRWLLLHPPRPFQEANTIDDSDASLASRTDANKRSGVYSKLLADQLFRARRRYEDLLRTTFNADQDSRNWQHARHLHGRFFMERCQLCLVLGSWGACVIFFLRSLPGAVDSPVIVWHVNLSSVVVFLSQ